MTRSRRCRLLFALACFCTGQLLAEPVFTVRPYQHQQVYETGTSGFTWYWNHLNNATNESEVFQWLFEDLNLEYIRAGFQAAETVNDNDDPLVIDWSKFAFNPPGQGNNWVYQQAKLLNPRMKVMCYGHGFPDWLRASAGHGGPPDYTNPNLYAEIAEWMFANLVNLKQNEGIVCDILDIYNEPDQNGFGRDNTANLLQHVIPLLRAWVDDPARNTFGVTMPKIMASSCMRASASRDFLTYWRANQPAVWDNIDIVSTHQYYSGAFTASNYGDVNSIRGGRPFMVSESDTLDPEGHLNDPNELPEDSVEDQLEAALLQGRFFSVAMNNGASVSDHYQGVSPQTPPASLIFTPWASMASRRKVYFAYKQLGSMQSRGSAIVPVEITGGVPGYSAVAYHLWGEEKSWITITNAQNTTQEIVLRVLDHNGVALPIREVKDYETSATRNAALLSDVSFFPSTNEHRVTLPNHCLRTFEISWTGPNQLVARDDWEDPVFMNGGTGWSGGWVRSGAPFPIPPIPPYNKNVTPRFFGNSSGVASMRRVLAQPVNGGVLRFKWDVDSLDAGETATAEVFDGAWHVVWTKTSADNGTDALNEADNLQQAEVSLDAFGPVTQVVFKLNANSTGDSFHLDDVELVQARRAPDAAITRPLNGAVVADTASALRITIGVNAAQGAPVFSWRKVSGPGAVTFANAGAPDTTAMFSLPGAYVLEGSATDASGTTARQIAVAVAAAPDALLSLWLKLNESSGTAVADSAGANVVTAAGGVAWQTGGGVLRGAASFDGVSGTITAPDAAALEVGGAFTLSYWFRADAFDGGLVSKRTSGTDNNAFTTYLNANGRLGVDIASNNNRFTSHTIFELGQWYHVALVFDGTLSDSPAPQRAKLYVNGALDTAAAESSASVPATNSPLRVGSLNGATFFQGNIDDVRLYRRAFLATEIASLSSAQAAPSVTPGSAPTATAGSAANLAGSIGNEAAGSTSALWSMISGPGAATFADATNPVTTATFSQPGAYVLSLAATNANAETNRTLSLTVFSRQETWRQTFFSTTANSGNAADLFDPNGDGEVNFLEFATAQNPNAATRATRTLIRNGATLEFTYTRSNAAMSDGVVFTVEWSDAPGSGAWSNAGVTEQILSDNGVVQSIRASVAAGASGRRFLHLKISKP